MDEPRSAGPAPDGSRLRIVAISLLGLVGARVLLDLGAWIGLAALRALLATSPVEGQGLAPEVIGDASLLALAILPGQVFLGLWAIGLARRAVSGPVLALGLGPGRARLGDLLLLVAAMPAALLAALLLVQALHPEPSSATMEEIRRWLTASEDWPRLLAIGALVSLVPALAEELFFRGWLQRRLIGAIGPGAGIGIASLAFAAMHWDAVQATGVLPVGVLLGYLAWRTDSLWPAVLGHAAFNGLGVLIARLVPDDPSALGDPSAVPISPALAALMAVVLASPLALGLLIFQLERRSRATR